MGNSTPALNDEESECLSNLPNELKAQFAVVYPSPLGQGRYARVFRCRTKCGEVVALKVLNTQEMLIKHARREAWREIRILKRLVHPTILMGHETIEVGESVAIVTEYVPG